MKHCQYFQLIILLFTFSFQCSAQIAGFEIELPIEYFSSLLNYYDLDEYEKTNNIELKNFLPEEEIDKWPLILKKNKIKAKGVELKNWNNLTTAQKLEHINIHLYPKNILYDALVLSHQNKSISRLKLKENAPSELKLVLKDFHLSRDGEVLEFMHKRPFESIEEAYESIKNFSSWLKKEPSQVAHLCHIHISKKGTDLVKKVQAIAMIKAIKFLSGEKEIKKSFVLDNTVVSYNPVRSRGIVRGDIENDPSHFEVRILGPDLEDELKRLKEWVNHEDKIYIDLEKSLETSPESIIRLIHSDKAPLFAADLISLYQDPIARPYIYRIINHMSVRVEKKDFLPFFYKYLYKSEINQMEEIFQSLLLDLSKEDLYFLTFEAKLKNDTVVLERLKNHKLFNTTEYEEFEKLLYNTKKLKITEWNKELKLKLPPYIIEHLNKNEHLKFIGYLNSPDIKKRKKKLANLLSFFSNQIVKLSTTPPWAIELLQNHYHTLMGHPEIRSRIDSWFFNLWRQNLFKPEWESSFLILFSIALKEYEKFNKIPRSMQTFFERVHLNYFLNLYKKIIEVPNGLQNMEKINFIKQLLQRAEMQERILTFIKESSLDILRFYTPLLAHNSPKINEALIQKLGREARILLQESLTTCPVSPIIEKASKELFNIK